MDGVFLAETGVIADRLLDRTKLVDAELSMPFVVDLDCGTHSTGENRGSLLPCLEK